MTDTQSFIKQRINSTITWEQIFQNNIEYDNYESNKHLYLSDNFDFKYNDHGFRCDNFNQESDLPIVFLGCSITEGCGMPVESIWAYQLLSKIRQKTNKIIPFWNLAIAGCGVDTQARHLYWFNQIHKIKFVFALFPLFQRREYCLESREEISWGGSFNTNPKVDRLFTDDNFMYHQTIRSFMIIDSILKQNNTQMYCSKWKYLENINQEEEIFLQNNFPNFNFFPIDVLPTDVSRDTKHPGPLYHTDIANHFWNKINHLF